MSHACPIMGCEATLPDDRLMCCKHWGMAPAGAFQRVYAAWARGNGQRTAEYATACHAAIKAVKQIVCTCPPEERMHSGWLHKETPDGPDLDPPVEMTRCCACWREYRADGQPHDENARIQMWAEWRAANPDADHRC